jgi:hypothetical protein
MADTRVNETSLQNEIRIALSAHGVVLRLNAGDFITQYGGYIKSGIPSGCTDLLFIGDRYVAFIEVKTQKGRTSPEQVRFIERMRKLGHKAGVARSVREALMLIEV